MKMLQSHHLVNCSRKLGGGNKMLSSHWDLQSFRSLGDLIVGPSDSTRKEVLAGDRVLKLFYVIGQIWELVRIPRKQVCRER